jgi:hypothetical protein
VDNPDVELWIMFGVCLKMDENISLNTFKSTYQYMTKLLEMGQAGTIGILLAKVT